MTPALNTESSSRWELVDLVFFGYLAIVVLLLVVLGVGMGRHEQPWAMIGFHLGMGMAGLGARALPRFWKHPVARFLRWWYPAILVLLCFTAVGWIIHLIHDDFLDPIFLQAERRILGTLWTPLFQQHARPWLTELMYLFYFSYYFYLPVIGLVLYLRGRGSGSPYPCAAFREFLFAATFAFWICYLHFLLTPVAGPVFYAGYPAPVLSPPGGPITVIERWLFERGAIIGGAFPSSHVVVAFVSALHAVRHRVMPRLFIPLTIGLAISTMYHGYHYAVDVIWAMVVAVIVYQLAARWFAARERRFRSRPAEA